MYHLPKNMSMEEGEGIALERAKLQAIADAFGTVVSQNNFTSVSNREGESSTDFLSLGSSEVKGEWIETIGTPIYNRAFDNEGGVLIEVSVKGRIREIVRAPINFQAKVLRNGTDDRYESSTFCNGDDLYLSFVTPVSGYVAVYLVDDQQNSYCLLPYQRQTDGIYSVSANQRYVFFCNDAVPISERPIVDEYTLTCNGTSEINMIYVIFSENKFSKAADTVSDDGLPRELPFSEFQKWLSKCRRNDNSMCVQRYVISLKNE